MSTFALAFRNVRKSYRDYAVYFLTILIGVAMFYVFNSLGSSATMLKLSKNEEAMLMGVNEIMSYLSVFISMILAFLILYANVFLIRRRKKELGIYMLLGMKKQEISCILVCETAIVGVISLVVGLALGILLSQELALLTAKLFKVSIVGFSLVFSTPVMWKSIMYFGITFVLVMLFNAGNLGRQSLVDMIYADKKSSTFHTPRVGISALLFIVSIILIGSGYAVIIKNGIIDSNRPLLIAIALGTIGTFLFFYSFSGLFLKLVRNMQNIYFKGLNIFTLGQLNNQINTEHISMSFVCLMMFLAISAISTGSAVSKSISHNYANESGTIAGVTYVSLYIGIVFILASSSVLAISQLSRSSDNRYRYALLSKLGADYNMLSGSLLKQISFYFALPLVLSIIHSIVAIIVVSKIVYMIGDVNILASCLVTVVIIAVIYGGYFLMTYLRCKTGAYAKIM